MTDEARVHDTQLGPIRVIKVLHRVARNRFVILGYKYARVSIRLCLLKSISVVAYRL